MSERRWMVRAEVVAHNMGAIVPPDIPYGLWAVPILEKMSARIHKLEAAVSELSKEVEDGKTG